MLKPGSLDELAARAENQPREINALEYLAFCLNGISRMDPKTAKAWRRVEGITTK